MEGRHHVGNSVTKAQNHNFHLCAQTSHACSWQDPKQAQITWAVESDRQEFSTTRQLWTLQQLSAQGFSDFTFFTYELRVLPASQREACLPASCASLALRVRMQTPAASV